MSTQHKYHDKIIIFVVFFFKYRKNFAGTKKRVRISHSKQAICVRAIEVRPYKKNKAAISLIPNEIITVPDNNAR